MVHIFGHVWLKAHRRWQMRQPQCSRRQQRKQISQVQCRFKAKQVNRQITTVSVNYSRTSNKNLHLSDMKNSQLSVRHIANRFTYERHHKRRSRSGGRIMVPTFNKQFPHLIRLLVVLWQLLGPTWKLLLGNHTVDRHIMVVLGIGNLARDYFLQFVRESIFALK